MPHGDFSDAASFTFFASGLTSVFAPQLWFASLGPILPMLDGPADGPMLGVIRFAGGLMLMMAPILFVVRWNTLNGKAGALGMWMAASTTAYTAMAMDDFAFKLRPWYLFALFLVLTGLHLAFNANPMLTSAMLKEKEDAKAAKKEAELKAA